MHENDHLIEINGIEPPLHLQSEPGRYTGFLISIKHIVLNDLNTGKTLQVTMPSKIEAEKLLADLNGLRVNDNEAFIMRVQDNLLKVQKYITIKTGN